MTCVKIVVRLPLKPPRLDLNKVYNILNCDQDKTQTQTSFGDFQVSSSLLREITKAIQVGL